MATRGGSDGAPKGEHLQPSTSASCSSAFRIKAATTEPTRLTIGVLLKSTDNFSEKRVIGRGAYGKVYRGILEDGEEIAVKLLHNNMQAIDDVQFQHEFDNLMMLNHENIVRLVGYCYETQRQHMDFEGRIIFGETTYRALCFEYMHMGSLQTRITDENLGLDWQTRYNIIKGTCEGLKYLHEGFKEPIYHLDLKPDNILLDKNMVPKLADFGISKLFSGEQTRVTLSSLGTIGYMPPEYLFKQVVSKKLDIFSLGVIITKIIAGLRGPIRSDDMPRQDFIDQVHDNWRNRLEATCTSETLDANCKQVVICTDIGLRCMDVDRHKRPSIVDIIDELDVTENRIKKVTTLIRFISNTPLDHNRSSKVPASSFSATLKTLWDNITKKKEHDILPHQDTKARLLCRQTVDDALDSIDSSKDYQLLKAEECPRRFKERSETFLESIITLYDHKTKMFDPKVRENERKYMFEKLKKVIIDHSGELIQKMQRNTLEQFKAEYENIINKMEETDVDYVDQIVDSCILKFMNSCEDLKVFDSDYLHEKCRELKKDMHSFSLYHILTIKEISRTKELKLAQQRSEQNMQELLDIHRDTLQARQYVEEEMRLLQRSTRRFDTNERCSINNMQRHERFLP
ncbi:unnamed protein product [Alopecurus aequalis]